jgi:carboxyl-terminal processing protease
MSEHRNRTLYAVLALVVVGVSFFVGFNMGSQSAPVAGSPLSLQNSDVPSDVPVDFSSFWKAWRVIDEKFAPSNKSSSTPDATTKIATNQERVWGAIGGMVDSLGDPYTVFLPPEEAKIFESDIAGNFEGVGMEIGIQDDVLTVIAPLKNTPAYRAGIKAGDKILKIDDTTTEKLSTDQAVRLIRGKGGTKVRLLVLREGTEQPFEISVTRAVIDIPTLDHEMRADGIFVIKLYSFTASSPDLFRAALREFVRTGSRKLVLDLRGNPGGYLEAAVDMASWFLPAGTPIVRESYRDEREESVHRSRGYHIFGSNDIDMVILIDKGSASASEILAGALSEHGVAKLVGSTSFGKGSVQELIKITPDSSLKVTIAQWLTPNGLSISAGGLSPDVAVENKADDVKKGIDAQFKKAVELLNK